MDLCKIGDSQGEEFNALAARILPLPKGVLPSTRFIKQTRQLLLRLNDRRSYLAA
jgi:hypothetical protein